MMTTQKGMQNIINKNTLLINQSALSLGHSLSLCGPVLPCKPPVTEAVYVAPGKPKISDSAKTSQSSLHTTDSEGPDHSGDLLLQSSPLSPVGSPHLVYAQLGSVKQTQVQPPANDDPVQYAQIEHQDKL